jgi:hypothetical protein
MAGVNNLRERLEFVAHVLKISRGTGHDILKTES